MQVRKPSYSSPVMKFDQTSNLASDRLLSALAPCRSNESAGKRPCQLQSRGGQPQATNREATGEPPRQQPSLTSRHLTHFKTFDGVV